MVRIIWTDTATSDVNDIYDFITQDSKLYAKRQVTKIRNKTNVLKSSKYLGKVVEEIGIPIIREIVEGNIESFTKFVTNVKFQFLPFIIQPGI
ncbi:MAG: type II toxin-antitoxin system RelE/ParE family toxin [Saprospiraceae bacterium]|nr:type II toxin-antitoxin system RelE/ParE family toxin [Saprospiraceae bacterium]